MARKTKHKVQIKEKQRLTPNSFQNIQQSIDKYSSEEEEFVNEEKENLANKSKDINDNEDSSIKEINHEEYDNSDEKNNVNEEKNEENLINEKSTNLNPDRNVEINDNEDNIEDLDSSKDSMLDTDSSGVASLLKEKNEINKTIETVEKVKKEASRLNSFFVFIIQLLINPIFWIVLGVIFVGAYISSTISIIGQNDYNILCDDAGIGSLMLDPNADDFTRQAAIVSWLTSTPFEIMNGQPLTREQAIGIMGNLMQESYGANPRAIQNDHSITKWETCDNQCVLSWGNAGGKAIGIIQWDTGRRQELIRFAVSEGSQWHDLNTQLKFLKKEMDSGYEYDQLIRGGFHETNKGIADYVRVWNQYFERSAEAWGSGNNIRTSYAEAFSNQYSGSGVNVAGGLANYCIGGMGGVDTTNLIQLAIASAWPEKSDSRGSCPSLTNCGQGFAMAAYKEIKMLAEQNSTPDPISGLLASCDRYVATMYRASGKDIRFPWGGANIQGSYMKSDPRWMEVSCQDRQPGDVLWRNGHVMLYLGTVNGKDSIGSASFQERTGGISGVSCSGNLFIGDGDTAIGFRMVNN